VSTHWRLFAHNHQLPALVTTLRRTLWLYAITLEGPQGILNCSVMRPPLTNLCSTPWHIHQPNLKYPSAKFPQSPLSSSHYKLRRSSEKHWNLLNGGKYQIINRRDCIHAAQTVLTSCGIKYAWPFDLRDFLSPTVGRRQIYESLQKSLQNKTTLWRFTSNTISRNAFIVFRIHFTFLGIVRDDFTTEDSFRIQNCGNILTIKTNRMQYLVSIYFNN